MLLELITLFGFTWILLCSFSFPSGKIFMKISWKLGAIVPNYCNYWTSKEISTPPIWVAIMWLTNKYNRIFKLILWHFPRHGTSIYKHYLKFQCCIYKEIKKFFQFVIDKSLYLGVCIALVPTNAWQNIVGVVSFGSRSYCVSTSLSSSSSKCM